PTQVLGRLRALTGPLLLACACSLPATSGPAFAQTPGQGAAPAALAPPAATFADMAGLVEAASIVALVNVRDQAVVEPERAPGLRPGHARLYVEARTEALLAGRTVIGESLVYLVDVPFDAKGKVPKLKKQ